MSKSTLKGHHSSNPDNDLTQSKKNMKAQEAKKANKGDQSKIKGKTSKKNKLAKNPPTNQKGNANKKNSETDCIGDDPVDPLTGEELIQISDFSFPDGFSWDRVYRSSHTQDIGLGIGWTHSYSGQFRIINDDKIEYFDHEGKFTEIETPEVDGYWRNTFQQIVLKRIAEKDYLLVHRSGEVYRFQGESNILRVSEFTSASGRKTTLSYDEIGRLDRIVTPHGTQLLAQYADNKSEHLQALVMVDEQNNALGEAWVSYQVNDVNDLVMSKDRAGAIEHYAYNNHIITQRTLPSGLNFNFTWTRFDIDGKCTQIAADNGQYVTDIEYEIDDEFFVLTKATDAAGVVTIYELDKETGKLLGIKDEYRNGKSFEYNENGQVTSVTQDLNRNLKNNVATTQYVYDDTGLLSAVTDAEGGTTAFEYNDFGLITVITNAEGSQSLFEYNEFGQRIAETNALGHKTEFVYNQAHQLQEVRAPNGVVEKLDRDEHGLLVGRTVAVENDEAALPPVNYVYNELGQLTRIESAQQTTAYFYDPMGRPIEISTPEGVERFQYDAMGQLVKHTDTTGRVTRYEYDGLDKLLVKEQPDGSQVKYEYNAAGQLVNLVHPDGQSTAFFYDKQNRLSKEVGVDGRIQQYEYNDAGHLIRQINGENIKVHKYEYNGREESYAESITCGLTATQYKRDMLGRLIQKITHTIPAGDDNYDATLLSSAEKNQYAYDAVGRLIAAENENSALTFEYDPLGQLIKETQNEQELIHEYNVNGQRTKTTLPDGEVIAHDFNALGQWQEAKWNDESLIRVRYNALGQPFARRIGSMLQKNDYDPVGRLINQQSWIHDGQEGSHNQVVHQRQYQYDSAGRIAKITNPAQGLTHYTYDDQDRLLFKTVEPLNGNRVHTESFRYDNNSNLQQSTGAQAHYSDNRLERWADKTLSYDDEGQLRKVVGQNKDGQRFGYNKQGQLTRVYFNTGSLIQATYAYDPLGRRITKVDEKEESQTDFLWDGDKLLREIRHHKHWEQPETITYLYEPNSFVPLVQRRNGQNYFYHNDHLGTPQLLTDATGNIAWKADYTAWGEITIGYQKIDNPLRFQGQYHDLETGLYYTRHRYYSPEFGRFITQDPIGLLGGLNSYQYAPNPVHWVDPLGLSCKKANSWNQFQKNTKGHFVSSSEASKSYQKMKEVQVTPKGERPEVDTYLPPSYIDTHLQKFASGASYIVPSEILDTHGRDILGWPDNTQFVMSKQEMDELIDLADGDVAFLEAELGIPKGVWQGRSLTQISIDDPNSLNLRMAKGTEMGANDEWLPGGFLPTGRSEAVIDNIPAAKFSERKIT